MCLLARTHVSSSQDTCVSLPRHICVLDMTNVPKPNFGDQKSENFFVFHVKKWNVGNHLKRVFPKSQAERSHPRGVNGRSKFCKKTIFFHVFGVEKWNVGDRLKRVFPKFEAKRSHPRGANGRSNFHIFQKCKTLNGRLPPKIRSYCHETWWKPVSDDSALFVFWRGNFFGHRR